MKILIAPDSFKGSLTAAEAAAIMAAEFRSVFPEAEIIELPLADGGEGTLEVIMAHRPGTLVQMEVPGPLGDPVMARYGLLDQGATALIEVAQAGGLGLIPAGKRNPLKASSFGTGVLIRDALDRGVNEIIVALGGSATVDGGLGMARALGYRLLDPQGHEVPDGGLGLLHLDRIDASRAHPRLLACVFRAAADVTNPLCGPQGAARVYGPQKGADPQMVDQLDRSLSNLQEILLKTGMITDESPGDGAAGGLGLALRAFCHARIESGAELVIGASKLAEQLVGADLLITGEGRTDAQTRQGKLCARVSAAANDHKVPVMLISGQIEAESTWTDLAERAFACSSQPLSVHDPREGADERLAQTARRAAQAWKRSIFPSDGG